METSLAQHILHKLPLAQATLQVGRWVFDAKDLSECFDQHRGRCYERAISFEVIIHLMADALINHQGNAKRCFEEAIADGTLTASVQAAYGKLRRMPIDVSESILNMAAKRLHEVWPEGMPSPCPASLDEFELYAFDGKTIKRVKKLLKPLRHVGGGLLGGRALTALSLRYGLVETMKADPDGHAAEVNMVPGMVGELRSRYPLERRLWVGDRGFCKQNTIDILDMNDDAYLLRYTTKLLYTQDNMVAPGGGGVDDEGREYEESWGWIGTKSCPERFRVRRIVLSLRDDEVDLDEDGDHAKKKSKGHQSKDLILITNLHDGDRYPAIDLLEMYRRRWHIERVFQEVTEVFGLEHLIGSSAEATIFQFSFCLILYNVIQLHRAFIAQDQERAVTSISTEKYFQDVRDELIACMRLIDPGELPGLLVVIDNDVMFRNELQSLLHDLWKDRWKKASPNRHRRAKTRTGPKAGEGYGRCYSVHRILQADKQAKQGKRRTEKQKSRTG